MIAVRSLQTDEPAGPRTRPVPPGPTDLDDTAGRAFAWTMRYLDTLEPAG
jgi:hypothetical protein